MTARKTEPATHGELPTPDAGVCELLGDARTDPHGPGDPGQVRACDTHPARRTKLLVVVLRIASIVAACRNNQASPAATSGTTATPSLGAPPHPPRTHGLFDYERRQPLAVIRLGATTGRLLPRHWTASPWSRLPSRSPLERRGPPVLSVTDRPWPLHR